MGEAALRAAGDAGNGPCPACGYPDCAGSRIAELGRLAREARELTEEYGPLITVTAQAGMLRADNADCFVPALSDTSGNGLREQLDAALSPWAAGTAVLRRAARAARAGGGTTVKWCRWCRRRVTVAGGGSHLAKAVHENGSEACADGRHLAAPAAGR